MAEIVAVAFKAAALVADTVTVCPVLQFDGVNVNEAGAAETVVAPALRATATDTLADGARDSATLKALLAPGATATDDASATIAGLALASTNTGTSAVLLLTPPASYAMACRW